MLPADQRPECTEGYEGVFDLISFKGEVETAVFSYIIRDHDMELYEQKKAYMQKCVDAINEKYGEGTALLDMKHQYYNMRKQVEPHYHIIEKAMTGQIFHSWDFLARTSLPEDTISMERWSISRLKAWRRPAKSY